MTLPALVALAIALATPAVARAADVAVCRASASAPASAFVGEQILYRVRIVQRDDVASVDWESPLSFPDFRAEWLPGRGAESLAGEPPRLSAREEHRALFALRAGDFEVPSARLRCRLDASGAVHDALVPPVSIRVEPAPRAGRPVGYGGVVGPISLQTQADPLEVPLGRAVQISISVRGAANLWDLDPPLAEADFPGDVEVFPLPSQLDAEPGERLSLRRFFRLSVVPHSVGTLRIPALRVPYLDPDTQRYEWASADSIDVRVLPAAAGRIDAPASAAPARPSLRGRDRDVEHPSGGWAAWLGLLAAAAAGGLLAAQLRRRPWRDFEAALAEVRAARSEDSAAREAVALDRALRAALAVRAPGLEALDPGEIAARLHAGAGTRSRDRGALEDAAHHLATLDRLRFDASAPALDRAAVDATLRQLRGRSV